MADGILVIDKPRGPTSHDVVARVRKILKTRHVGHAGTLDPMATGVLVVAVGEATKLVPWLTADDKTYAATIRLGTATSTHDAEGVVTRTAPIPDDVIAWAHGSYADWITDAFTAEMHRTEQIPPAVSAIKIDGERAHALARAGKLAEATLAPRPVKVRSIRIDGARDAGDEIEIDLTVAAAKGYFVRALARDLAEGLETVGHLVALRRLAAGAFRIEEAIGLDGLTPTSLIPLDRAAAIALPVTRLDAAGVREASFGRRVAPESMTEPHPRPSAWLDAEARLVAVGEQLADGSGRVLRGFPRA